MNTLIASMRSMPALVPGEALKFDHSLTAFKRGRLR